MSHYIQYWKRFIFFGFWIFLFFSCESPVSSDSSEETSFTYPVAIANVDYNNVKRTVFFDFSTGNITEVARDIWDIAISPHDRSIISNGGDWGFGVKVVKTTSTDITEDLSSFVSSVKEYTFKANTPLVGYQNTVNCFDGEIGTNGQGSGYVYLVQDEEGTYYKVKFNSFGPMGQYNFSVVTGLAGTETRSITGSLGGATAYDYIYFDLGSGSRVTYAPPLTDWDLRFTRTHEILNANGSPYVVGRSDVLINSRGGVQAASVTGKTIEEVSSITGLSFSSILDAIGYSWYTTQGTPPTFIVSTNTYVIQTTEGRYAKFQPASFYGPNREQFYMKFRYYYQADGSQTFSH